MTYGGLAFGVVIFLLVVAIWLLYRSRQLEQRSGLPAGTIIYTDSGTWIPNSQPLYAQDLHLAGKPDYLLEQNDGSIVPVEIKSARAPAEPWDGHVLQLAAYCLLVERNFRLRPAYGIIQYRDRAFAVDYTEELEADLLDVLAEMREDMFEGELDRDHNDWGRCARCGVRNHCYQRLA
ncbi:MAG TPA: PD-(D/E)XK nuclease family protein [Anaerolineae bacterium]